jgi:xylulokinase
VARPVVVAYDVGTSGVKAVVVDGEGSVLASDVEPYGLLTPRPGWVEQDLEAMLAALGTASRAVVTGPGIEPADVVAVAVTGQMFSTVPVDRDGQALRPMLSWLDQRSEADADELSRRAGSDRGYGLFDAVPTGKDIIPKIAWLRRHDDHPRTAWYLDCKEAIVARLTGNVAIDPCGASAYRLVNPTTGQWDAEACAVARIPLDRLPPIGDATAVAAGQIGAGARQHGDAHLSLGTAAYFGITTDRHLADPEQRLGPLRHVVPGRWIVWLETATGGGALAWFRRQLAGFAPRGAPTPDHAAIDRAVEAVADEMDGLLFAPWLTGERVPLFDDAVRGGFLGLALHHGAPHLARAVMEGVACQIATAFDYGLAYRVVGGGGIGAVWTGIIADTLGRPLDIVSEPQDAAARGVAACALVAAGIATELETAVPAIIERTVQPDPARIDDARERLARFRGLHAVLRTIAEPRPSSDRARDAAVPA